MDSDKVLVLGQGKVLEFDAPAVLLRDPDGVFSSMVTKPFSNLCVWWGAKTRNVSIYI